MGTQNGKIQITFSSRGAVGRVTGSNHFLDIRVKNKLTRIMLDFGAVQEGSLTPKQLFELNDVKMDLSNVEHIIVSHAHLDHTMNLCQLSTKGFVGDIYMTDLTLQLVEYITEDGINIHEKTVEYLNKLSKSKHTEIFPYMNMRTRQQFLERVKAYDYDRWIELEDGIRFKFIPNGHISGSAAILIEVQDGFEKETILYTGDTSADRDIPFTKKLDIKGLKINHLITESTYGGVNIPQRKEKAVINDLYRIIKSTCVEKKGKVLIPSFAMSRSTNLAYYIKKTYDKYPELSRIPIYMVSPLMNKCHKTIGNGFEFYDEKWKAEKDFFNWKNITPITNYKEVLALANKQEPCVIIASSGMGDMGVNAFLLPNTINVKKNTVCFVGYCAEGTAGYKILTKQQKTMTANIDGVKKTVNIVAHIENLTGLSSHACGNEIVEILETAEKRKLRNVIAVHGDSDRCIALCDLFKQKYKDVKTFTPRIGEKIKLTSK